MRVALIDDNSDYHFIIKDILHEFDVESYFTGEDVFRKYYNQEHDMPSVFIVDYFLDGEIGTEAIKRLNLVDYGILIIGMTSAFDDPSVVKSFYNVRCDRVISKDRVAKLPEIIKWMARKRTVRKKNKICL